MKNGSNFFEQYPQKEVTIRQYPGKSPMFFRDLHMTAAVFLADLRKLSTWVPDEGYRPLEVFPGRGIVALHCLEYLDSDIGPYNEISLSAAVRKKGLLPAPLQALHHVFARDFHVYIKALPVNTEVAWYGGVDFFNFPKTFADISFRETASHRICTLREKATMDLVLEVETRKMTVKKFGRTMTMNSYPEKDGKILRAKMMMKAPHLGVSLNPFATSVRVRKGKGAEPFGILDQKYPMQTLYAPHCQAILFEPEIE